MFSLCEDLLILDKHVANVSTLYYRGLFSFFVKLLNINSELILVIILFFIVIVSNIRWTEGNIIDCIRIGHY